MSSTPKSPKSAQKPLVSSPGASYRLERDWRAMAPRDFDAESPEPQLSLFAPDSQGRITPDLFSAED